MPVGSRLIALSGLARLKAESLSDLRKQGLIDAFHGKLAGIDRKIGEWAKRNLAMTEEIDPQDARS
jgi:hypothetical protein